MRQGSKDQAAKAERQLHPLLYVVLVLLGLTFTVILFSTPSLPPAQAQDLPTVTPTRIVRIVTEITSPQSNDAVAGTIGITGSALLQGFRRYELHIAGAGSADWRWLVTSEAYVSEGELFRFDTTRLPDGYYDLRLRAVRDDGNYAEAYVQDVEIRNANPPTPTPYINSEGTLLPTLTPPPSSPTPTPTPKYISFIPNGQGIYVPLDGGVMRGKSRIAGTANGFPRNPFVRFELSITPAGHADWQQLRVSTEQIWQDTLYTLDTTQYLDGLYDLRLRIVYRDANYDEFETRNVYIANYTAVRDPTPTVTPIAIGIIQPRPNDQVSGFMEVMGAANPADFATWELAWRPSGTQAWALLVSSTEPVPAYGRLATLDLTQLPIGAYDFRLRVINQGGSALDFIVPQVRVSRPPAPATPTPTPFG
ncbi:MAG: hypothetical protein KF832_20840 [Caldilineaceae bacterium]|nr:hypothetical protein [Caldilineaceae bacterium]